MSTVTDLVKTNSVDSVILTENRLSPAPSTSSKILRGLSGGVFLSRSGFTVITTPTLRDQVGNVVTIDLETMFSPKTDSRHIKTTRNTKKDFTVDLSNFLCLDESGVHLLTLSGLY